MTLIEQRTELDCAVCCIAMATGRTYEEVYAAGIESLAFYPKGGCADQAPILRALGLRDPIDLEDPSGDFLTLQRPYGVPMELFRRIAWGRRAILEVRVRSFTGPDYRHAVYWDGSRLFDPSTTKPRLEDFGALRVEALTVFREGGADAPRS